MVDDRNKERKNMELLKCKSVPEQKREAQRMKSTIK